MSRDRNRSPERCAFSRMHREGRPGGNHERRQVIDRSGESSPAHKTIPPVHGLAGFVCRGSEPTAWLAFGFERRSMCELVASTRGGAQTKLFDGKVLVEGESSPRKMTGEENPPHQFAREGSRLLGSCSDPVFRMW